MSPDRGALFGEEYFRCRFGSVPYERNEHWLGVFNRIAEQIIARLEPRRVLDAGCAKGFLVEALRDRGVDAWGIDISPYAISQVRPDIRSYCRVASLTEPLEDTYDLITCIEVLEHMPPEEARPAIENLTRAAPTVLFSSTPSDFSESTHVNVQPPLHWLTLFFELDFWPDLQFDASFVAPRAILFRKATSRADAEVRHHLQEVSLQLAELSTRNLLLVDQIFRAVAERDAAREELREVLASPGWRLIGTYRDWYQRIVCPHPRLRKRYEAVAVWLLSRISLQAKHAVVPRPTRGAKAQPPSGGETSKFMLLISGCPGDTMRYRCEHQAEQLRLAGLTAAVHRCEAVDFAAAVSRYEGFLLHRVPRTLPVETFIRRARELGKPVVFDTDDLVFDERAFNQMRALELLDRAKREEYVERVRRYHATLRRCSAALVSTEPLAEAVRELFPQLPVYVNRNAVSDAMVQQAEAALREVPRPDDGLLRIAYFSGTRTHHGDLRECVPALQRLLREYPHTRLMLVGHIEVPAELAGLAGQLETVPLIPWEQLPPLIRRVDISLAPLEPDNRFTECKSEVKYLEAALLGVPTVASDTPAYRLAIRDGENGLLCRTAEDWYPALERLALDPELRARLGTAARRDALERYTTRSRSPQLLEVMGQVFRPWQRQPARPLSVAILIWGPIPQTGGGYHHLFVLGHWLAKKGHDVRFYVEPIAPRAGLSQAEVIDFCHRHFGQSAAAIHVGHDQILPSDIAVATNWYTAYTVAELENTKCKLYLVQDFEPDFYERDSPTYQEAERTYGLPLKKVTLGSYLAELFRTRDRLPTAHIPFSLDRTLFRNENARPEAPVRILFFARPGLRRRAYPVGVEALRRVVYQCPEVRIAFYGMEETEDLGFPYQNLGRLSQEQLAREMNLSHIHLSFSLTNISWVPLEAMACGCAVVEARAPGVEHWVGAENRHGLLVEPEPKAVAQVLHHLVTDSALRRRVAESGEKHVASITASWEDTCTRFESILLRSLCRDAA